MKKETKIAQRWKTRRCRATSMPKWIIHTLLCVLCHFSLLLLLAIFHHLSLDCVSMFFFNFPVKEFVSTIIRFQCLCSFFSVCVNALLLMLSVFCFTFSSLRFSRLFSSKHFKMLILFYRHIILNMYTHTNLTLSPVHTCAYSLFRYIFLCLPRTASFSRSFHLPRIPLAADTGLRTHWVIYTQLSGTRVAINIFLIAWTLISKSIDVAFADAVVVVVGPIATAVTIAVDVGFIVPPVVVVVLQLLLLFVKYEPSIKSWDGTFVVTDFSSKFFGRFSWPEYLMSNWWAHSSNSSRSWSSRHRKKRWKKNKKESRWLKISEYVELVIRWERNREKCPIFRFFFHLQSKQRKTRYQNRFVQCVT